MVSERRKYLFHHIDKRLGVSRGETTNCFLLILARKNCLDQRGEFFPRERTLDQSLAGYSGTVEKSG